MGSGSPCASCKLLRRRCTKDCIFAPFFPADDPHKFAIVHKVFGASNVSKMLQELPAQQQGDAVSSLVYEANDRMRDPVYGCVGPGPSPSCRTRCHSCRCSSPSHRARSSASRCSTAMATRTRRIRTTTRTLAPARRLPGSRLPSRLDSVSASAPPPRLPSLALLPQSCWLSPSAGDRSHRPAAWALGTGLPGKGRQGGVEATPPFCRRRVPSAPPHSPPLPLLDDRRPRPRPTSSLAPSLALLLPSKVQRTTQRKILGYATGCHLPSPPVLRSAGPCSGFPSIVSSEGVLREGGAGMGEEEDPDWLRAFQPPTTSTVMLSSDSYDSPENSPTRTTPSGEEQKGENKASSDHVGDGDVAAPNKGKKATPTRRKTPTSQEDAFGKDEKPTMESNQDKPAKRSTPKKLVKLPSSSNASKVTGPKAGPDQIDDTLEHREEGVAEVDMQDKLTEHSVSQRLPLIIPDKVQRSKALIECDGDSIDLSGDVGAVGRIVISNSPNGNQDLLLDLKGTLDGFTFDSDEEGDKLPEPHASQNDQNNEDGDQPKAKTKRKAEKPAGKGQKKAKVAGKATKKGTRKTQTTKRTKKAKK
uniref:LOB domain-containing protein n=1 Tax=Oryza meridionalis TaxID=40149 RepID=A0A0E0CCL8_9ORYZ